MLIATGGCVDKKKQAVYAGMPKSRVTISAMITGHNHRHWCVGQKQLAVKSVNAGLSV
jgi:hypothetical protein